ncbi:MAG: ribonuclease E/G [Rhodobacteraceae bacterium]|nr:ribonuclease E/G [Paracoccaceae bacterium]MCY4197438.1 ribonuclease E/G [Paracoccaceae bacterium]
MAKKLLIDAAYPEETRVALVDGSKLTGYEFESTDKQLITSNVYLARVVRIEAALQAAFVEYGGNRHGFLTFQEIHPDYFNIPVGDQHEDADGVNAEDGEFTQEDAGEATDAGQNSDSEENDSGQPKAAPTKPRHRYRVQEVIRKGQILLVQVTKEERGGKGAALTTYISLAGRYCVLMPNSDRGGGISRKISNIADRRKLKEIADDLAVPNEAGLIIRTAGFSRTKQEIRRDYNFLVRQWNEIRERTLKSVAPTRIYEEGSLIRRAIRDDYSKDMDEILVQGDAGYKSAKNFMKMIMPSHAKKVKQHNLTTPIFTQHGVESQVTALFDPVVRLRSGGYLVIDRTEALVAIDVNSGRSTRQGSLEQTALNTNLEAAEEAALQIKLRDLAGIIVIDFIDMDEPKNNQAVTRRLRECVKMDRSRITLGTISEFGLLEMSRQRLKPGIIETATVDCPACRGTGRVRGDAALAVEILRQIDILAADGQDTDIEVRVPLRFANVLANDKRQEIHDIESRTDTTIIITGIEPLVDRDIEICRVSRRAVDRSDETRKVLFTVKPFGSEASPSSGEPQNEGPRRRRATRGGQKQHHQRDAARREKNDIEPVSPDSDKDSDKGADRKKANRRGNRKRRQPQAEPATAASDTDTTTADASETPEKSRSRSPRRRQRKRSGSHQEAVSKEQPTRQEDESSNERANNSTSGKRRRRRVRPQAEAHSPQDNSPADAPTELAET